MTNDAPVRILWTGGWDSTYRLLVVLLELGLTVEPWYMQDDKRASSQAERQAMDRIRTWLAEQHPVTQATLLPTRVVRLQEVLPDAEIERAFANVIRIRGIGDQYAFLARFVKQFDVDGIELSLEKTAHGAHGVIKHCVAATQDPHGFPTWRVFDDCPDQDIRTIFGGFSMPLFDTVKADTLPVIARNGWNEVMAMTWFCHTPAKDMQPCGFCNPCQYAIQDGFGWRIPPERRALSKLYGATLQPLRGRTRQFLRRLRTRANA
jgi:7-cyano-7-deazaguanine synthase in queuosine biosynthesis